MNWLGGILVVSGFALGTTSSEALRYVIGLTLLVAGFVVLAVAEEERARRKN